MRERHESRVTNHKTISALLALLVLLPASAHAFPFGGQASIVRPCYNAAIYAGLGAPRGGPYIWTTATKTYQFGPPRAVGQWLLGLASVPYHCVVSINPVIVWPGTAIMMMGSSQAGGGAPSGGAISAMPSLPANSGGYNDALGRPVNPSGTGVGHILISEVFPAVDTAHGVDPTHEWLELFNASNGTINISGWTLGDASGSGSAAPIPNGTYIKAGEYIIVTPATSTQQYWSIPAGVQVIGLGRTIGNGLDVKSDRVVLTTIGGATVDAISWGADTYAFPPLGQLTPGKTYIRSSLAKDTDSAADWVVTPTPTPGR